MYALCLAADSRIGELFLFSQTLLGGAKVSPEGKRSRGFLPSAVFARQTSWLRRDERTLRVSFAGVLASEAMLATKNTGSNALTIDELSYTFPVHFWYMSFA